MSSILFRNGRLSSLVMNMLKCNFSLENYNWFYILITCWVRLFPSIMSSFQCHNYYVSYYVRETLVRHKLLDPSLFTFEQYSESIWNFSFQRQHFTLSLKYHFLIHITTFLLNLSFCCLGSLGSYFVASCYFFG